MSETEDIRAIVDDNDFQSIVEGESGRSSSVDFVDTFEDVPKETARDSPVDYKDEEIKEKETFLEHENKVIETEKKQTTQPADTTTTTTTTATTASETEASDVDGGARRDEAVSRVGAAGTTDGRNQNVPVGEWNSLPVLVERLREALELSLATGSRRDDEPPTVPEDSGVDSEEDFRIRSSMEQAIGDSKEPELKRDLKFLEDLLLSDIQTALSRLRETLESVDVIALAKHGAASDPTSKLHLLRLVSSLLSRLQVPEEKRALEKTPLPTVGTGNRRRRGTRHTIGVSTEELARARKWLEERNECLPLENVPSSPREQKEQNGNVLTVDRKPEEVRDKCTKDAINQRQLLEDKNKEIRVNGVYRGIQQVDTDVNGESNMYQAPPYRANVGYPGKENDQEDIEERSRVSKLAAALRQRAELATSGGKYAGGNKFSAKKSKIKRANTIDIPSYLKLQESLGHESTGCVSLRRPINVGDRTGFSSTNVAVPTFQPKTENDRKFMALINKNNEQPTAAPVAPFKVSGFAKTMDMSSLTNEQWNNRFSNIKTTFDKPSPIEERENKASLKARANKRFSIVPQQTYGPPNERPPNFSATFNAPAMRMDTASSFRHAPSSPFRKIEKSSPVSPSKVPASYHWPKNAPMPTNTVREKARMMFDRENVQPSSKQRPDAEKHGFPRPPWIDQDRNEGRANGSVTENGKLDYRSFCKQFAPFVGKGSSVESKRHEDQRQRESAQRDRNSGVVDGKFSFKMVPDRRASVHQYPPVERVKGRFPAERKNSFEVIKSGYERETDSSRANNFADATLRGSSSVAVQTGINEDHQDEGRSFRVAPRISRGASLVCSNASVQTSDPERPTVSVSDVESAKQWKPPRYEQSDPDQTSDTVYRPDDGQRFVLDRSKNFRTVSSDSESNSSTVPRNPRQVSSEQGFREPAPVQTPHGHRAEDRETRDYASSVGSPGVANYKRSDETSRESEKDKELDWPVESSGYLDDENIQNQDISPEVGVVTRYTCAIGTVASSVDSPEPRSEEMLLDSRASSSPSPSQLSWSKSRPPTNERTATPEEDIRRHNLLQQSLVRRLQNEITTLNEPPHQTQPPTASAYGQHLTVGQTRSFSQSSNLSQPSNFSQSPQPSYNQPANFDQPSGSRDRSPGRVAKFLAPVPQKRQEPPPTHSPGPVTVNRVGSLREAYEQPASPQTKPIQKERSPIPNGVTPIDSSDEYLVSCATKPSRSIVLSKSESWHQLALSTRAPRVNVPASTPMSPHAPPHPKPPKPRSPSSQRLRSKQFEASSMADSVKKMEDKIRQYFDHPADAAESRDSPRHRRSPRTGGKGMVGLFRSRTMPGISDEKLRVAIPGPQQAPLMNVNTADVDKVFDDLFEEATRTDGHQC